jgi:hypothetical protein
MPVKKAARLHEIGHDGIAGIRHLIKTLDALLCG